MAKRQLSPEERRERIEAAHAMLVAEVETLTSSAAWLDYLKFVARFPTRSARNNLLIRAQCPDATAVLGFRQWEALGRHVRRGEHGLRIFAPVTRRIERDDPDTGETDVARLVRGFRLVSVFDVSQTDGEPLPADPVRPQLVEGEAPVGMWEELTRHVTDCGFTLELVPTIAVHPLANGITIHPSHLVQVATDGRSPAQQVKTLAHELAHVRLHGDGETPRPIAEVEAESVAFLIAESWGLDTTNYTVPYVAGWGGRDTNAVLHVAERVQRCAAAILVLDDATIDDAAA